MSLRLAAARVQRGALPSLWLMTDAARGGDIAAAMRALPRGAGVIFRHYEAQDREALARNMRALARERGLAFLVAGDIALAVRLRADGFHAPEALVHRIPAARRALPGGLVTAAAHGWRGLVAARRHGADAVVLSPVFATTSHPGAPALGPVRFAALASAAGLPVFALGGIDDGTAQRLAGMRVAGFAAIGALSR
jgi:thiamine-phosphate pyrophosphorylase